MARYKQPKLSDLRNRVALCSMKDVVEKDGYMTLARDAVARVWGRVDSQTTLPSFIGPAGYAVIESEARPTHIITIRGRTGVDITSAAWVYEEFLKSPPRWYKVLGFFEDEGWLGLQCHLVEKSDMATPPRGELSPQPSRVRL